jgi:hypothetical protein
MARRLAPVFCRRYPRDAEKLHRDIVESMQYFKPRLLREQDFDQGHGKSKIFLGFSRTQAKQCYKSHTW